MAFSDDELHFIQSQLLLRLSTVGPDGQPDVVPVAFEYDGTHFYVGGANDPRQSRKGRNVAAGNARVALVLDDLVSIQPWTPRYLRVYGTAELVEREGRFGPATYLKIAPTISWSWNLEGRPYSAETRATPPRRTVHRPPAT